MSDQIKTNFDERAANWEKPQQIIMANGVAATMICALEPTSDMSVMDYGCGSGLVTMSFQPLVRQVVGVDSSRGMLEVFQNKVSRLGFENVSSQLADLEEEDKIEGEFDLIVSSMAFHHVRKLPELLKRLYDHMVPGGSIGIADLDKEDGTFHSDNTGVAHFGFDRKMLKKLFEEAGFHDIRDVTSTTVERETEGKGKRQYTIFLMTGKK
ncbi:MAG: class I SAM-dependent methyltransferase [Bacteroidales bacterium]|nr:class I SAM-dependent methyltransferase [Bacteroidales bacterium]